MSQISTLLGTLHKYWIVTVGTIALAVTLGVTQVPTTYNVNWSSEIEDNTGDLVAVLYKAKMQDTVVIHLDSPGGSIFSGVQVIDAMKACKGHIKVKVNSLSASMAAMWTMYADEININDNAIIVFHTYQALGPITVDERNPLLKQIYFQFKQLYDESVAKLFTKAETDAIIHGTDLIMTGKEFKERVKHGYPHIKVD